MAGKLIVQKYGGSSVADASCVKRVASRIAKAARGGDQVVVVVSARGDTTDELLEMAAEISPDPPERELDMLLSVGERISMALLSMAIHEEGLPAISFTGSQAGIITDESHTRAKIVEIKTARMLKELVSGKIVIVAGFQGVSRHAEVTTLGRGGSDTSAVALAAALKADNCEIYTDVSGVFTADPRLAPEARKIDKVSYEEMLEMAATGAKVMQLRAVEYGRLYNVPIHVRSSFDDEVGTWIQDVEESMEKAIVSAVTSDSGEAKITIFDVPDRPGIAATVFSKLAEAGINVDMILQNVSRQGDTDISFTLPLEDLTAGRSVVEELVEEIGAKGHTFDEDVAKVSLVGAGMKSHPGVAAKMFSTLAEEKINIEMISTSTIKISCIISAHEMERAVKALHRVFELE